MNICCKLVRYNKGKSVPLQAWSGPEGSRKLRFPDFMTTAQDGGKIVSLTYRPPLPPRKYTWYSFTYVINWYKILFFLEYFSGFLDFQTQSGAI